MKQVETKFGLTNQTLQRIIMVLTKFSVIDKAVLYGSRAKGNYKNGSDIDLCLFGKNLDLRQQYRILDALDELFLPYKFDLTVYETITNDELKAHINRVGFEIFTALQKKYHNADLIRL